MIILPDRNAYRSRFLVPMRRIDWMPPSLSLFKDQFGNDGVRIAYRIRALLNDGHVAWKGVFDDREDFDAFLFALASGSLQYEPGLWRLPTPAWHPGIGENLSYDFATVTFLTTVGSTQTYFSPVDWNNANNSVEGIGGGGSGGGAAGFSSNYRASGGGGGEYRRINNYTFSVPGTSSVSYLVGRGGLNISTLSQQGGSSGVNTTWDTTALIAVAGKAGAVANGTTASGGAGGTGGTGAGGNYNGGAGGSSSHDSAATGAGGAAGPNGAGSNGTNSSTTNSSTAGGAGGTSGGGAGGTSGGGAGGSGTEWQASPARGSGGGGGGNRVVSNDSLGGSPGSYGGGSGAAVATGFGNSADVPAAAQGIIVVTYTPVTSSGLVFTIPMMGL